MCRTVLSLFAYKYVLGCASACLSVFIHSLFYSVPLHRGAAQSKDPRLPATDTARSRLATHWRHRGAAGQAGRRGPRAHAQRQRRLSREGERRCALRLSAMQFYCKGFVKVFRTLFDRKTAVYIFLLGGAEGMVEVAQKSED